MQNVKCKIKVTFFVFFIFLSCLSHAQEFTYEFSGKIIEQPAYYFLKDDYLLNPNGEILDFSLSKNRFYGDINFNLDYQNFKFISKFRPTVLSDKKDTNIKTIIDDGYLDIGFKDRFFLYLGKRNIRDGVGLGSNPTDFLGEGKEVDMAKREEERRVEREGNYLIGMDTYFKDITLTAIFAPHIKELQDEKDRVILKAGFLMEPLNTDISFHYFNSSIPGAGINISTTIGESLVLHTESALRWGSDRKIVRLIQEGSPNLYEIYHPDDNQTIYPHIAAGGHYTFKDGTNVILEYLYNGDGYNSEEWNTLKGFIKYSYDEYKTGFLKELMKGNLLQANEIMRFRELRRNYIFARISNSGITEKIDGALVFLLNTDDKSFLIYPSVDYKIKGNTTVGFSAIIFVGENDTEFGMTHWGSEVSMVYRYFF
ncbi:MAG: hypothetical protein HZB80_04965 [Deltaproteobacteria bacterium]|nr:hypothetical protein [Deltaproteobacteria bacterium]